MNKTLNEKQRWYWKKNIRLIASLLVVWAIVGFGGAILFAEPLNDVQFLNVSLSFWLAHQGSILVFILLILIYALRMDKLDKKYKSMVKDGDVN
ncbi:putative solute:sodium symporter small subunit [Gracilibacillus ureilyticus]|uniref:Putative solute:sodium symporter small subunit n=1 Tax=Gracilibacillus ureilyticus TaxID=531814 RepID=A0A1H9QKL1_9BACI|nr:DUF4212 domain-containing protein [Gracilibacillus ureilyticus]SER60968.1 putative solute:sodium symporter small subunit [Gracilibacillus ureilyticus]